MACGHALSQAGTHAEPTALTQPLQDAPPRALLATPEGERRQATVLFSDLSGYTAMNEQLDPEEVQGIMRRIKAEAVRIIEEHGGIVNQFVGDEILALFGIPTAHEDDPVRAVRAACALHEMVRQFSPQVEERIVQPLRLHTGINSGLIVAHRRDPRDGTYGITGDTVNTGARLAARAQEDEILISLETQRRMVGFFETEALAAVAMKGKAQPVSAYRVREETPVRTRFEVAQQRGFTPYTGREQELAMLHGCLERALAGQGQFVTVFGEAGVGKSRLLFEFRYSLDREYVTVLEGRCQSYGVEIPYLPFLDGMRRGLQLRDVDSPDRLFEKAVANVRAIDPVLERYLPHYLHLLSIPSDAYPMPPELQGDELRRAFEEALVAIVTLASRQQPLVFILEDWHWADAASDAVLHTLSNLLPHHPLMLIVLSRPDVTRCWGHPEYYTPIVLQALDIHHTETMLDSIFGVISLPEGLGGLIYQRTGGNPLFIEEMCHSLIEAGTVGVQDGAAILTRELASIDLPDTVHAVIRARVDRLAPEAREVLRLASVIGREFTGNVLETLCITTGRSSSFLDALQAQNLVQQVRVLPEPAYRFKHDLTQVVVYDTLLLQQRKALHQQVGQAIETHYADRLGEHYETLAYHYRQSTEPDKAVHYLELAGDRGLHIFHLEEARRNYWAGLNFLDTLKMTPDRRRKRIALNLKLAAISADTSPSEAHIAALKTSLQFAREMHDDASIPKLSYWLGNMIFMLGDLIQSRPIVAESVQLAEACNDSEVLGGGYTVLGQQRFIAGEYMESLVDLEHLIPLLESQGNPIDLVATLMFVGLAHAWLGKDFPCGYAIAERALQVSRSIPNKFGEAWAYYAMATVKNQLGEWHDAIVDATQAVDIGQITGDRLETGQSLITKGYAVARSGKTQEGVTLLRQGIATVESLKSHLMLSIAYAWLAELTALQGNCTETVRAAEKALSCRQFGDNWGEIVAYRALAMAAAQDTSPDWPHVEMCMQESLRLAQERAALPDLAMSAFRYAEMLWAKRDLEQGRDFLMQATTLFRKIGMTWWLEQGKQLESRFSPAS
jgi:class 3 adenylate cyclase/tetratricopeptide (TPR) repeat protein